MRVRSTPTKVVALSLAALTILMSGMALPAAAFVLSPTPTFTLTGTPALSGPTYVIVYGGDLWVADWGSNHVYEYAQPYTTNEAPLLTLSVPFAGDLIFDSSGNLWAGEFGVSGQVLKFAAPITNGESPSVTLSGFVQPVAIALNQGNLWVADGETGNIYEYSPAPTTNVASPPAPVLTLAGEPYGIVFDSANNLWVSSLDTSQIFEFTSPVHSGETASITDSTSNEPSSLAFDGAGNLWVVGPRNTGVVEEFTTPLTNGQTGTNKITISSANSFWGMSIDSSGNIWVADFSDAVIDEFSGLAAPAAPAGPVQGPIPLPAVIPKHLTFNFASAPSIVGNEVAQTGVGVLYNVKGYSPTTDTFPNDINICSNAANSTVTVKGFVQLAQTGNATEFLAYYWSSLNFPSQGWPKEPSC